MTQADRVYSTPPTNTPISQSWPASAPGALSVCPASVIPASRSDACQATSGRDEPDPPSPDSSDGAGSPTLSRRLLMNMFVSSAAVAAAPAVAMNSAAHEPPAIDHKAILARVEQIVDLLRTRYICEGWKMDEHGAARALDYFRRHIEGPPAFKDEDEETSAYHQALEFFSSHGQNLHWIHDGSPGGMSCNLPHHSAR